MISLFDIEMELKYVALPLIYILIGIISFEIIKKIINGIFNRSILIKKRHHKKKADTLRIMILSIIKYVIAIFVVLASLTVFGINVSSIIAGLGITAAIIGLAFQDIAKDFLAGIAIIADDLYEIGDTIEIGDFMGEVVAIGLKTTRVRDFKGRTKIFSNRSITEVINYNLSNSVAVVDFGVAYEEDNTKVEKVLEKVIKRLEKELPKVKNVELLGIVSLDDSAVVYRMIAEVNSMEQYVTERIMRKVIKETLDKEQIKIPYPQIEVHNGN